MTFSYWVYFHVVFACEAKSRHSPKGQASLPSARLILSQPVRTRREPGPNEPPWTLRNKTRRNKGPFSSGAGTHRAQQGPCEAAP